MYVDSEILIEYISRLAMEVVLMTCQPVLFKIRRKTDAIMVLPGGFRCSQVPVNVSNKIKTTLSCQLPFTVPLKGRDTGDQLSI